MVRWLWRFALGKGNLFTPYLTELSNLVFEAVVKFTRRDPRVGRSMERE